MANYIFRLQHSVFKANEVGPRGEKAGYFKGIQENCASCGNRVTIYFHPTEHYLDDYFLLAEEKIKELLFKADLTFCGRCYHSSIKPV